MVGKMKMVMKSMTNPIKVKKAKSTYWKEVKFFNNIKLRKNSPAKTIQIIPKIKLCLKFSLKYWKKFRKTL
jgi:hypothetical protein